ncbi:hypothetical protein CapIbe_017647 [Capra ibex]
MKGRVQDGRLRDSWGEVAPKPRPRGSRGISEIISGNRGLTFVMSERIQLAGSYDQVQWPASMKKRYLDAHNRTQFCTITPHCNVRLQILSAFLEGGVTGCSFSCCLLSAPSGSSLRFLSKHQCTQYKNQSTNQTNRSYPIRKTHT